MDFPTIPTVQVSVAGIARIEKNGAPVSGNLAAGGDGAGYAGKGSTLIDYLHGDHYINVGDATTPNWKAFIQAETLA